MLKPAVLHGHEISPATNFTTASVKCPRVCSFEGASIQSVVLKETANSKQLISSPQNAVVWAHGHDIIGVIVIHTTPVKA